MQFKKLKNRTKIILIIQCIGMLMGTSTHVAWAIHNGFLSENYNAPLFSTLFWDSLTFLDPLAAFLLIFKPKWGVYLTLFIITADVIHNNAFYFDELYIHGPEILEWITKYWMILGQLIFALFVWLTFKGNIREINLKTNEK